MKGVRVIRAMTLKDKEEVLDLLYSMYLEHKKEFPDFIPDKTRKQLASKWDEMQPNPLIYHYVYEEAGRVIAYVNFSKVPAQDDYIFPSKEYVVLDNVVVHKEYQRQGIGTRLIYFVKDGVKKMGYESLELYVMPVPMLQKTRALYGKLGFVTVSHFMSGNL